jgi:hypothetical protein
MRGAREPFLICSFGGRALRATERQDSRAVSALQQRCQLGQAAGQLKNKLRRLRLELEFIDLEVRLDVPERGQRRPNPVQEKRHLRSRNPNGILQDPAERCRQPERLQSLRMPHPRLAV